LEHSGLVTGRSDQVARFWESGPMISWFQSATGLVMDLPAQRSVEGIMIALLLAAATASLYGRLRRNKKDALALLTTLILAGNVSLMLVAGTAVGRSFRTGVLPMYRTPASSMSLGQGTEPRPRGAFAERLMAEADENHDGRLAPDEAGRAASRLIRELDENKEGSIPLESLDAGLRRSGWLPMPGGRGRR
jgi:hypothetical protein